MTHPEMLQILEKNHDYFAQHGAGLCMANALRIYYELILGKKVTTEMLAKILGTSSSDGTHDGNFHTFLREQKIPFHEEVECSMERFLRIVSVLPDDVLMMVNIWDMRFRVEYRDKPWEDLPEGHELLIFRGVSRLHGQLAVPGFDSDTLIGKTGLIRAGNLFEIWHDGPFALSGCSPNGETFTGQENIRWFILLGMNRRKAINLFGPPEHERAPINKIIVPSDGRLKPTQWEIRRS